MRTDGHPESYTCFDFEKLPAQARYARLTEAIIPRPIALVSSCDAAGQVNLSPFSFFNIFGISPPILVFSPTRSGQDNSNKHTLENVQAHPEVVIHMVSHAMVQQTSLSSTAYAKGINEFTKAGFKEQASTRVRPPRIATAPIAFECRVQQVVPLGNTGGAGNLVVCEVLLMHVQTAILDKENGKRISPQLYHPVARMGDDNYCTIGQKNIFAIKKPTQHVGVGVDVLPASWLNSTVLHGNELGMLGNLAAPPHAEHVAAFARTPAGRALQTKLQTAKNPTEATKLQHEIARAQLQQGEVYQAWLTLSFVPKITAKITE